MNHSSDPKPGWDADELRRRLEASGYRPGGGLPLVAWFGDDPAMALALGDLARRGRKAATAGLLWKWQHDGKAVAAPGDRQVIVDWSGAPLAVIEMTDVSVVPFDEVDAAFARAEGEGDRSLEYWRHVHWRFFARECRRIGREPAPDMPVICMRFRVVHAVERT